MYVNVQITVNPGDNQEAASRSPEEIAIQVLDVLGGDAERDTCTVTVTATGVTAPPPPPEAKVA